MNTGTVRQFEFDGTAASCVIANEQALVQQAIEGDANALELLLAPNLGRLLRVALAMLRNREDAEDALQDGLCKAHRRLSSFQGRSSFATWLTRIVMNSALMILRRKRSHPEFSLDAMMDNQSDWLAKVAADKRPNPEQICAMVELNALIEEQILRLPAAEQAAFRHYTINGHSMVDSCLTFGIPATTFKSRILRTRRKLARGLQHSLGKAYASSPKRKSVDVAQR